MKDVVSTIVRFHDLKMIRSLERAVQSLQGQMGVCVQPIVITQRMDDDHHRQVIEAVKRQWFFSDLAEPLFISFHDGKQDDARTRLLNAGVDAHWQTGNRYLGFLDCDDVLYSHAYSTLRERLNSSSAAFAFATVERAKVVPLHDYDFIYAMDRPFRGDNKLQMLKDNFSPIHSYLLDTSKLTEGELRFNEELSRLEDYEFLLRVASKYPCDFSMTKRSIGLYVFRSDGRNSTSQGLGTAADLEKEIEWKRQRGLLESLRSKYEVKFYASDFSS